jgi:hypothetical protein
MAVYFGSDQRFIKESQRLYSHGPNETGPLLYGKEPISRKLGPGYYFDKEKDNNRNWNTKPRKKEPMSLSANSLPGMDPALAALLPDHIVLTGPNYRKFETPGVGSYSPKDRGTFGGSSSRPHTASSSRARQGTARTTGRSSRRRKEYHSSTAEKGTASAAGTTTRGVATLSSGNTGLTTPVRPSTAGATRGRNQPGGIVKNGMFLENNRFDDGSLYASPGPGAYNLESSKEHFSLTKSHNAKTFNSKLVLQPKTSDVRDGKSSAYGVGSQAYLHLRSMRDLGDGGMLPIGSDQLVVMNGSESSVSLSMSEQMALVS